MEKNNYFIAVNYQLNVSDPKENWVEVEKTTIEKPFQWISNMGVTLEDFERQILSLQEGDNFDFILDEEHAYGKYETSRIINLNKSSFCINGHFDSKNIYPGAIIPLMNDEGNRFEGLVLEIKEDTVTIDLNHPLAGRKLHFKGSIVTKRLATTVEIEAMANMLSGESTCECGCGECHNSCDEAQHECCGKHHQDNSEEKHCCGKNKQSHNHHDCCQHHND